MTNLKRNQMACLKQHHLAVFSVKALSNCVLQFATDLSNLICPSKRPFHLSLKKVISFVPQIGHFICPSKRPFHLSLKKVISFVPWKVILFVHGTSFWEHKRGFQTDLFVTLWTQPLVQIRTTRTWFCYIHPKIWCLHILLDIIHIFTHFHPSWLFWAI